MERRIRNFGLVADATTHSCVLLVFRLLQWYRFDGVFLFVVDMPVCVMGVRGRIWIWIFFPLTLRVCMIVSGGGGAVVGMLCCVCCTPRHKWGSVFF